MKTTLLATAAVAAAITMSQGAAAQQFTNLLVYGDSLSDAGRLFLITNGAQPPSPPYAQRFSNGPVWVEQLAPRLGFNFTFATDFAVGGAESGTGGPVGVTQQLALSAAVPVAPTTLTVVWVGANDYFNNAATVPTATLVGRTVTNIATAVGTVTARGGRTFLVPNLPDLGRTPGGAASGSAFNLSAISNIHNTSLASALRTQEAAAGVRIIQLDVFGLFNDVLANPGRYGFANTTVPCITPAGATGACANATAAAATLYFDPIHPTTAAHGQLAAFAAAAIDQDYNAARTAAVTTFLGPMVIETMRDGVSDRLNTLRLIDRAETTDNAGYGAIKYAFGDREDSAGVAGFAYRLTQATVGYDAAVGDNFVLGGAFSYTTGEAEYRAGRGLTDVDSYGFAVYAGYRTDGYWIDLSGAISGESFDIRRNTGFAPRPIASGKTKGRSHYVALDTGINLMAGDSNIVAGPIAGVRYVYSRVNAYTETDAAMLGVAANRAKTDGVIGGAGVQVAGTFASGDMAIAPRLRVLYENELRRLDHEIGVVNSVGTTRTAIGGTGERDGFSIGAGVSLMASERLSLSLDYEASVSRGDGKDNVVQGRAVYRF